MDEGMARQLWRVVRARANLLGKRDLTDADHRRLDTEMEKMPGEFRVYAAWWRANNDEKNQELAKSYEIDDDVAIRLAVTGGDGLMRHQGSPESVPGKGSVPGTPGNLYGVAIRDTCITPS